MTKTYCARISVLDSDAYRGKSTSSSSSVSWSALVRFIEGAKSVSDVMQVYGIERVQMSHGVIMWIRSLFDTFSRLLYVEKGKRLRMTVYEELKVKCPSMVVSISFVKLLLMQLSLQTPRSRDAGRSGRTDSELTTRGYALTECVVARPYTSFIVTIRHWD